MASFKFFRTFGVLLAFYAAFSIIYQSLIQANFMLNLRAFSPTPDYKIPSQKWIQEQINRFYDAMDTEYQPPSDWTNMPIHQSYYFPEINIIFTGIPKTGCSHWKELFLQAEGVLDGRLEVDNLPLVHKNFSQPYRLPRFSRVWKGLYDEKIKTATSLVAFRNPWVRAVSGYRQKLSNEETQGNALPKIQLAILHSERIFPRDVALKPQIEALEVAPTFEEYVRFTLKGSDNILNTDPHFAPQHTFLKVDKVRYDYIIPMEFAEQMSTEFFKKVGLKTSLPGSYDKQNDPRLQTSVVKARELFSSLDKELVDKFYEVYKWDFMLLDYSNFSDPHFPFPNSYY